MTAPAAPSPARLSTTLAYAQAVMAEAMAIVAAEAAARATADAALQDLIGGLDADLRAVGDGAAGDIAGLQGQINTKAPSLSPGFSGSPTTTYPPLNSDDASIPNTQWCRDTFADWGTVNAKAPLNSPLFTGDARAPTPGNADWDVTIATTAFVKNQGYTVSDRAMKTDLAPFAPSEAGRLIDALAVRAYRYLDDAADRPLRVGLVAQEVEDVFPDAVVRAPHEGEPLRLDLRALVPVLLAEAQSLRARVAALEEAAT